MSDQTKCPECELEGYAYGVGPLQHRRPCGSLVTICSGVTQVTQSESCKTIQALKSDNEAKDFEIKGLKRKVLESDCPVEVCCANCIMSESQGFNDQCKDCDDEYSGFAYDPTTNQTTGES